MGHCPAVVIPLIVHVQRLGQLHPPQLLIVTHGDELQSVGVIVIFCGQPVPWVELEKLNVLEPLQLNVPLSVYFA
jgi:hypothetical protein